MCSFSLALSFPLSRIHPPLFSNLDCSGLYPLAPLPKRQWDFYQNYSHPLLHVTVANTGTIHKKLGTHLMLVFLLYFESPPKSTYTDSLSNGPHVVGWFVWFSLVGWFVSNVVQNVLVLSVRVLVS